MSGPDTGRIALTRDGAVAILTFSNPPEGYMDAGTETALAEMLERVETDPSIRAVVLTGGQDGVFIRHYDTRILEAQARKMQARGMSFDPVRPVPEPSLHVSLNRIERSPKPYVAAINGAAMGGGYELALACDIRIAEAGDYPIGLPEVRIGLLPGAGGTQRLAQLIGPAKALECILLGETFGPAEAAAMGLVNRCVDGPVLPAALALTHRLAALPAKALAHAKRLARPSAADAGRLAEERTLFCDLMVTQEAIDLMARMHATGGDIRNPAGDEGGDQGAE
jgi:enoyl-CoA hydratase